MAVTSDTAQGLQKALGDEFIVSWAMCYGVQRIDEELRRIAEQKPECIVVLPLYARTKEDPGFAACCHDSALL